MEVWTPERKRTTIHPQNYPTYNIHSSMSLQQAKSAAKEYNQQEAYKKRISIQTTVQVQNNSYLNNYALPATLVAEFKRELQKEYSTNLSRLKTVDQHWVAANKMLSELKINFKEYYEKRFDIFNYYEKRKWSSDYIKRITKICNKWGSFCARRTGQFFEPIPKIGIRYNSIAEARDSVKNLARPATSMQWQELRKLKSSFQLNGLAEKWNWLFIGLFFGLRPSEINQLKKGKKNQYYKIQFDKKNKIDILHVYQSKLTKYSKDKRWKIIPVNEPEQKAALKLIQSGKLAAPLVKTLRRFFDDQHIGLYSPRKGFTDLMLGRGYQLEDISTFLGHSSIETTWKHYKNKFAYQLPKKKAS